jgi:hypothetical protein
MEVTHSDLYTLKSHVAFFDIAFHADVFGLVEADGDRHGAPRRDSLERTSTRPLFVRIR